MSKALKSVFECAHPEKYIGDHKNIICRSSWERWFCHFLDANKKVVKWASEEIFIPYISPVDGRPHRYFVDFIVLFSDGRKSLIEIKPYAQTIPPVPPKKKSHKASSRYQDEMRVFLINQAKWDAAREFGKEHGFDFHVFTERELKALGGPF